MQHSIINSQHSHRAYWVAVAVATAVVALLTALTTIKEDDIIYTFIDNSGGLPMTSLADVVRSHMSHIVTTNGRFANFLAQLFCGYLGKVAFDVCNALVFAVMLHCMVALSAPCRRPVVLVALACLFVMTTFPNPGETMMWLTGSTNYMWAVTATLALWLWLRRYGQRRLGWAGSVALWIAAAVAGNMNEATSFGFFTGMALWLACNRRACNRTMVVAMTGYLAGIALIVASPGAWQRLAEGGGGVVSGGITAVQAVVRRLYVVFGRSAYYAFPAMAIAWGVWRWLRSGVKAGLRMIAGSQVWCVFVGSLLWMLLLAVDRSRAFTFYAVVSFVAVAGALWRRLDSNVAWQRLLSLGLFAACIVPAYNAVGVLTRFRAYDSHVKQQIAAAPEQAVIEASTFKEENRFLMPVCYNSANYYIYNPFYCQYFHKKNVQFLPANVLRRYRSGNMLAGGQVIENLQSSMPDVSANVYEFPGEDFAVVPLSSERYATTAHIAASIATGLSSDEQRRRYVMGFGTATTPINVYYVVCRGLCCLVLPALPADVAEVTLPLSPESGITEPLKFTRR